MLILYVLGAVIICCVYEVCIKPVHIIDVEWSEIPHDEAIQIYDQIIKGEIEVDEN